jgi:hypothetical protein
LALIGAFRKADVGGFDEREILAFEERGIGKPGRKVGASEQDRAGDGGVGGVGAEDGLAEVAGGVFVSREDERCIRKKIRGPHAVEKRIGERGGLDADRFGAGVRRRLAQGEPVASDGFALRPFVLFERVEDDRAAEKRR